MDLLVTYDIDTTTPQGERRLVQVAHLCEEFGTRVQKSVFECRLSPTALQRLEERLLRMIDRRVDSVHIYRFDGDLARARLSLGRGVLHEVGRPWIM